MNKLNLLAVLGLSVGVLSAQALPAADVQASVKSALAGVSGLELPSRTADLIAAATGQEQSAVTVSAIEAAVTMNPSAAAAIVSAVAAKVPSMAALAAATAAKRQPKLASMIAEAATKAAPDQAAAIVTACSKEQPSQYVAIAVAASKAAPAARHDILIAASEASPAGVSPYIAATAGSASKMPVDVAIVSAYTAQASASQGNNFGACAPGPSGEVEINIPSSYSGIPLQPGSPWGGQRQHSGSPIIGF